MSKQAQDSENQLGNWPEPPLSIKQLLTYLIKPSMFGAVMLVFFSSSFGIIQAHCDDSGCMPFIVWTKAIIGVPVLYLLINGFYNLLVSISKPFGLFRLCTLLLTILIVTAFLASIIMSKYYLGYYFFRPDVFNEMHDVKKVNNIIPFETEKIGGTHKIYFNLDYSMDKEFERFARWSYYAFGLRNLVLLKSMGIDLPKVSHLPPDSPDYYALVRDSGILLPPDPEHVEPALLRGLIIGVADSRGRELVLIAARDGLSSNDHYPYYELLFEKQPGTGELTMIRSHHFYGGEDDSEWYWVWRVFSWIAVYLAFLITILVAVIKGIITWLRPKPRPPASAQE